MPITIRDVTDDAARLEITCIHCKRVTWIRGQDLLRELSAKSRKGVMTTMRELQAHGRCKRCGYPGEVRITFPSDHLDRIKDNPNRRSPPYAERLK